MNPLLKKTLVAVAAKQVLDKVAERRRESQEPAKKKLLPVALLGLAGVAAFLVYRFRQED